MKISIKQIKPGMILSTNVVTSDGSVLVPAEQKITQDIISTLIQNEISSIEITNTNSTLPDDTQLSPSAHSNTTSLIDLYKDLYRPNVSNTYY